MRLIIHEDDCNGEARAYEAFVHTHHPEIQIDFRERTSGVGDGLFNNDGCELDHPDLWSEYCNTSASKVEVQK